MLMIEKPELARILLSKALEKLPSTRKGEGYYIGDTGIESCASDLIYNLRNSNTLGWDYGEYEPKVGDVRRYEIARVIIRHHIRKLRYVSFGRRLAKTAKDQFVADIIVDFHAYGLFNQQKKALACEVAEILVSGAGVVREK